MEATEQHFLEALFIGYLFQPSSPNGREPFLNSACETDGIVGERTRTSGEPPEKFLSLPFPRYSRGLTTRL